MINDGSMQISDSHSNENCGQTYSYIMSLWNLFRNCFVLIAINIDQYVYRGSYLVPNETATANWEHILKHESINSGKT